MLDGCDGPSVTRGMCSPHYYSYWKYGDALWVENHSTYESKVWENVDKDGPIPEYNPQLGPCWLWTGSVEVAGYGTIEKNGKKRKAHIVVYEMVKGLIPDDLEPDHLCRVRSCCNPSHLELVTHRENVLRGSGPSAENARKTQCKNGHHLSGDNLRVRINSNGFERRDCLECYRISNRKYKKRVRELIKKGK